MSKTAIPEVVLSSDHKMPLIGLGTAGKLPPPDVLTSIFVIAIETGYRHFDTAAIYGSEEQLGRAVAEALRRGLIKSRDELFITSKLSMADSHHDLVLPAINNTLKKLGLEYVDLYLIHWPVRLTKNPSTFEIPKEDMLPFDIEGTWKAVEECSKLGLAKSIGVSNFGCKKLSILWENATIPPAVNQVEINVAWQQEKMRKYCNEKGIHVSAWSPLGATGAPWGSLAVVESPIIKEIAQIRNKSIQQVALRWIHEQGTSVIVKSFNKERMKENLQIFQWELSHDEAQRIKHQIPQRRGFSGALFVHEDGPYKSLNELWDDDA